MFLNMLANKYWLVALSEESNGGTASYSEKNADSTTMTFHKKVQRLANKPSPMLSPRGEVVPKPLIR